MIAENREARYDTHDVLNQVPPLENYNPYEQDAALKEGIERSEAKWAEERISAFGAKTGTAEFIWKGHLANKHTPELVPFSRTGERIDEVEFHPAYHDLFAAGIEAGMHALPWIEPRRGAHAARAAIHNLLTQVEAGVGCPITMTFSAVPALRHQPNVAEEWIPRLTSLKYDPRLIAPQDKLGCTVGMAMTEKQGGSDVRANTTVATPIGKGGPGEEYLLTGHKWFCSAPMCDAFLTLAQTPKGVTCFLVPRILEDGTRNRFFIQRLKDKMGNRSNASSEIEYHDTWARMIGEEGRGVPTIIEMVTHTRLDCVIGSAAVARNSVARALHHTAHRSAFGKTLIDQPLMQNVLADLAITSEAMTTIMFRLTDAYDLGSENAEERAFARLATAVSKYWVCKSVPPLVAEALECHGGNGFVEESMVARHYREAPLSSIWEGSGNVMCLDVLRAMNKEPETVEAFMNELDSVKGSDSDLDAAVDDIKKELMTPENIQTRARRIVEKMADALQATQLIKVAPKEVSDAFLVSRIAGDHGGAYGTLPTGLEFTKIIDRARPKL